MNESPAPLDDFASAFARLKIRIETACAAEAIQFVLTPCLGAEWAE